MSQIMDTRCLTIDAIFRNIIFNIPYYQRPYSWNEDNQVWDLANINA